MTYFQWFVGVLLLIQAQIMGHVLKNKSFEEKYTWLHRWCVSFIKINRIPFKVAGENHLSKDTVFYACNHQSFIDPLLISAAIPYPMTYISKAENNKLPVVRLWAKNIEMIAFDRADFNENVAMLRSAARKLQEGRSILIFPEGTRSKSDQLLPFKVGALLPATLAKVPIVPVALINADRLNEKKRTDTEIVVSFGEPILPAEYKGLSHQQLSDLIFKRISELRA
ncbi:MAG: lysophospholipid acyltransferase family protein [Erysipelotrichaceae bacterium]|nr:lysophospholipid acyltransferase family protein [Erysipelotrichaceae bacterium]